MRKFKGFKLGKSLIFFSRWVTRRTRIQTRYHKLGSHESTCKSGKAISKILTWGRRLSNAARSIRQAKPRLGYVQLGSEPIPENKPESVPKGHLAVYVGQKGSEFHRVLVPVIYFNHPLFGQLLSEAEKEYGFQHEGGITIPCQYTEFEQVKTRIASGSGVNTRRLVWKRHY